MKLGKSALGAFALLLMISASPLPEPKPTPTPRPSPLATPAAAVSPEPVPASVAALLPAGRVVAKSLSVKNPQPRFALADKAYKERRDKAKALEALEGYRAIHQADPEDEDAAWRLGMATYSVGFFYVTEPEEKKKLFAEGKDACEKAAKKNDECVPCHFFAAINLALYSETVGIFKTLTMLEAIREHLRVVTRLEPTYGFSGADRTLGLIEQKLPGLFGGSNDRARKHFEAALKNSPDEPLNYLFLARLLDEKFSDTEGAIAVAKKGLEVQIEGPDRLEAVDAQRDLRIFLEEKNKKK